jgi:hypothetical protein
MDRTAMARKLREALFDHIETEHRDALQDGAIDSLFEKVLASCEVLTPPGANSVRTTTGMSVGDGHDLYVSAPPCFTHTATAADAWGAYAMDTAGNKFTYNADSGWPMTDMSQPVPAIGDVNLHDQSVYVYKDGVAQWISVHDAMLHDGVASTRF